MTTKRLDALSCLQSLESHDELLKHYGLINTSSAGNLSDLQMFISDLKLATNDPDEAHILGSNSDTHVLGDVAPVVEQDYKCLLEALFVRSWDVYLARTTEIARQLEVKNFVTECLPEDAISDVAMELEEITINSQKLGDLVQSKVAEGTRKLQAKLAHLEKTIPKKQKGAQT
jgi:hypothetical protein